jgi:lysophospholipase L1-like esterase
MLKMILTLTALAVSAPAMAQVQPAPHIEWQVQNPFRLFKTETETSSDANTLAKSRAILASVTSGPSLSASYTAIEKQLRSDRSYQIEPIYLYTAYDRSHDVYEQAYVTPKSERIVANLVNPAPGDTTCTWSMAGGSPPVTQPCSAPFVFSAPFDQTSFHAQAQLSVQTASTVASNQPYTVAIDARDLLVLGFGDSYGAGEGNPDRPADLTQVKIGGFYAKPWDWWHPDVAGIPRLVLPQPASADWWSNECHRSMFSPQVLAALKLAAADPHQSVTFMGFACAGAAVLDGFVVRQDSPPGEDRLTRLHAVLHEPSPGLANTESQLQQAVDALCSYATKDDPITQYDPAEYNTWDYIYSSIAKHNPRPPTYPDCKTFSRKPDIIFVTLGGNDIGFAGLGAWALMPPNTPLPDLATRAAENLSWNQLGLVCPEVPYQNDGRCLYHGPANNPGARALTEDQLPHLLSLAGAALTATHLNDHAIVIQESYPAPFTDAAGNVCGTLKPGTDFASNDDLQAPWRGLNVLLLNLVAPAVDANAGEELAQHVLPRLNQQIALAGAADLWIVAPSPPNYQGHGFCAGASGNAKDFAFPTLLSYGFGYIGVWDPRYPTPASWDPYDPSRARWLRESNDTLLTEMVSDAGGDVLPESIDGMLHPTAAGEAAVADQLYAAIPATLTAPPAPPLPAPAPAAPAPPTPPAPAPAPASAASSPVAAPPAAPPN